MSVYDALHDELDALAVTTVAAPAAPSPSMLDGTSGSIPHNFCSRLRCLLQELFDAFPEREKLGAWIAMFDITVMGNEPMQKYVIQKWNYDMTHDSKNVRYDVSLYEKTKMRDMESLRRSDLWVFKEIDAYSMYYDKELDEADRAMICSHFDTINDCARMYAMLPPGFAEIAQDVARTVDPTQPITPETTHAVMQRVMGMVPAMFGGDPENAEKMIAWATQLGSSFADGSTSMDVLQSLIGGSTLSQLAPGLDLGALMESVQRDVTAAVTGSDTGALDGATMMSIIESQTRKVTKK